MAKYLVELSRAAKRDLDKSLIWGIGEWGPERAGAWYDDMHRFIRDRLLVMPMACPLAPEAELSEYPDLRQLISDRYRVLFVVRGTRVRVLRILGSYSGSR